MPIPAYAVHTVRGEVRWKAGRLHASRLSGEQLKFTTKIQEKPKKYPVTGVMIATPAFRGEITNPYYVSLHQTMSLMSKQGIVGMHGIYSGESMVHVARNILVAQFMAQPSLSHLFFIDADMRWSGEDFMRLLAWTADPEVAIVCAAYPKKTLPVQFACNLPPVERRKGELAEILDAPTGFMCIRRDALEKLMAAHPEAKCHLQDNTPETEKPFEYALFDSCIDPATRRYLREDFTFTRRWQKLGGVCWVDPRIWLGHQGLYMFEGSLEQYYQNLPAALKASVTGPESKGDEAASDQVQGVDAVEKASQA